MDSAAPSNGNKLGNKHTIGFESRDITTQPGIIFNKKFIVIAGVESAVYCKSPKYINLKKEYLCDISNICPRYKYFFIKGY